jgi:hypothetical protein
MPASLSSYSSLWWGSPYKKAEQATRVTIVIGLALVALVFASKLPVASWLNWFTGKGVSSSKLMLYKMPSGMMMMFFVRISLAKGFQRLSYSW